MLHRGKSATAANARVTPRGLIYRKRIIKQKELPPRFSAIEMEYWSDIRDHNHPASITGSSAW